MANEIGGSHYEGKAIQPIEYIQANELKFDEGCVVKYISRHEDKKGLEDVFKAIHNCLFVAERCYGTSKDLTNHIMSILNIELENYAESK